MKRGVKKDNGVVAVAIDSDKNSQHALKWAGDHLLSKGQIFYLLHIRRKITSIPTPNGNLPISDVDEDVVSAFLEQDDLQTKELLLPFQCFCSRRGLQCKEVILDELDVPKAIVDFVMHQSIDKLVMGASSRSAFIRTFKKEDVPTTVCKIAPDFCSVYVISKGKISTVRPAKGPNPNTNNINNTNNNKNQVSKSNGEFTANANLSFQTAKSEPYSRDQIEAPPRTSMEHRVKSKYGDYDERVGERIKWLEQSSMDQYESFMSCPSPSRTGLDLPASLVRRESGENSSNKRQLSPLSNNSLYLDAPQSFSSLSTAQLDDVEAELRRLKLELKQKTEITFDDNYDEGYIRRFSRPVIEERDQIMAPLLERERKPAAPDLPLEKRKLLEAFSSEARYRRYTAEEIKLATDYFSDALKIGEGGYGPVYKSMLDHSLVAIKILKSDVTQGMKQFQQEVEVLSSMRHPNMVQLLGACPEYGSLVYEYMSNGSLEDWLLCRDGSRPLSWQLRFKIATEVATGLLFLHQTRPEPLVHRDLKPANILLDHNLVGKISDVGLARLIPQYSIAGSATSQYKMTAAAGTFCYIDPEYQKTGMVGTKSDVYALGIIFLQLITAKPPMGLAHHVGNALEEGRIMDLLDPDVPDWPMEETVRFAELALRCAELRRKDRPDLASVVLPELTKLRALAGSVEDNSLSHQRERSQSFKVSGGMGMASFVDTKTVKGTSFMM